MNFYNLAQGCAECRVCKGAAYQTPPVLFAGHSSAPIVAIGQNPGEIKDSDKVRQQWLDIFKHLHGERIEAFIPVWYMWDFYSSPGHKRLEQVFGKNWLLDGEMLWTNAVRCRTEGNAAPPKGMIETCKQWTQQILEGRKAIIMVGGIARSQVLGKDAARLDWGIPKKHPRLGYILSIKHYSVWTAEEVKVYREAVKRIKEKI